MSNANNNRRLLIISPIFFGNASGASVYYQTLTKELISKNIDVVVISDNQKGSFRGDYHGIFPKWAGQNRNQIKNIISYILQNITYLKILSVIRKSNPNSVLIHSSLFNHHGILQFIIKIIKIRYPNLRLVIDVRDKLLYKSKFRILSYFDHIIACSLNIKHYLSTGIFNGPKISYIPILFCRPLYFSTNNSKRIHSFNIQDKYLLYIGAIKEQKGIDLLIDTFLNYFSPSFPDYKLVLCGLMKTNNKKIRTKIKHPKICYLGKVERLEVYTLISNSELCINLSPEEGLPRVCLESISLNKPTILPKHIPEFDRYCPKFVMASTNPKILSDQLSNFIINKTKPKYPIEDHFPENVIPKYINILF